MGGGVDVLVVEDHEVFREGLRAILESRSGYRVVGETDRVHSACAILDRVPVDLVISDLRLPGPSGISLIREMRRMGHMQPILMLTMLDDPNLAAEALVAGSTGFVLKSDPLPVLLEAVSTVTTGRRFLSPNLPKSTIESFVERGPRRSTPGPLAPLSVREREIFDLLVWGYDNQAVGKELFISIKTVETHRGHIFRKLGVHSMADLMRFAFRNQLLRDPPIPQDATAPVENVRSVR